MINQQDMPILNWCIKVVDFNTRTTINRAEVHIWKWSAANCPWHTSIKILEKPHCTWAYWRTLCSGYDYWCQFFNGNFRARFVLHVSRPIELSQVVIAKYPYKMYGTATHLSHGRSHKLGLPATETASHIHIPTHQHRPAGSALQNPWRIAAGVPGVKLESVYNGETCHSGASGAL